MESILFAKSLVQPRQNHIAVLDVISSFLPLRHTLSLGWSTMLKVGDIGIPLVGLRREGESLKYREVEALRVTNQDSFREGL